MTVTLSGFELTASLRHPTDITLQPGRPFGVVRPPLGAIVSIPYMPQTGDTITAYYGNGILMFTVATVTWNPASDKDQEYGYPDTWQLVADPASTFWEGPFAEFIGGGRNFLRTEVSYPGDLPITLLDVRVEQGGVLVPRVVTMQAYEAARTKAEATWAKAPLDLLVALSALHVRREAVVEELTHLYLPGPRYQDHDRP